jgi:hypothetical protein
VAGDPRPELLAALRDLGSAGFEFEADVAFRVDPYRYCEGIACADLLVIKERRTIAIAPEAVRDPPLLRAALLEIWERYRQPRPGSLPDLARGALRVVRDGSRVGVDTRTLRRAQHDYRKLWESLEPPLRAGLEDPDALPFP